MQKPSDQGGVQLAGFHIPLPLPLELSISKTTCLNLLGLGSGITGLAIIYQSVKPLLQNRQANTQTIKNTASEIKRCVVGFGSGIAFLAAGIATLRRNC